MKTRDREFRKAEANLRKAGIAAKAVADCGVAECPWCPVAKELSVAA